MDTDCPCAAVEAKRATRRAAAGRISIPEVGEREGLVGDLPPDQRDRRLQVVALCARDAHRVALDRRVDLELALLDERLSLRAVSPSMPLLTTTSWRTLSPPIFSIFASRSRKRTSTLRLVSLASRTSATCPIWKSLSA
jgi:hypothetical protein